MENLEKMKLTAQILRARSAIADINVSITEKACDIERMKEHIKRQEELISQKEKQLFGNEEGS